MATRLEALPYRHVLTLPGEPSAPRILSEPNTDSVPHATALLAQLAVIYSACEDCLASAVHDRHSCQPSLHGSATGGCTGGLGTVVEFLLGLSGTATRPTGRRRRGTSGGSLFFSSETPDLRPATAARKFTTMTIDWRYTREENLGILSVAPYLGPDAVRRLTGSIGWVTRGTGPVIVDLNQLPGWSAEDQPGTRVIPGDRVRSTAVARRGLPSRAAPEGHVDYAVTAAAWAGAELAEGSRAARQAPTAAFGGSSERPAWPVSQARMGLMFLTSGWMRRAEARPAGPCVEKETAR